MAFTFDEAQNSRSFTKDPPTYVTKWIAAGEFNDAIVEAYAYAATATIAVTPAGILYRKNIKVDEVGFALYNVTVEYASKAATRGQVGSWTFDYDTTGATVNIKCGRSHVQSYPDDGDWHKGAIGVNGDNVEGADVILPALKYNMRYRHPQGVVTIAYTKNLARNTGRTNNKTFMTFEAGELLFGGSTGSDGSEAEAEAGYILIASANETGKTIADITGIAKQGHDILWIEFEDDTHAGEPVRPPKRVHIERWYENCDFAAVFGWSA